MSSTDTLSASLEAALLRELGATWDEINQNHFRRRMRRPVVGLSDAGGRLGAWIGARRTIELGRGLIAEQPWAVVREVLKHEMAHQFVDEVLGIRDETAHGPAFERVCREQGFDASARGVPSVPGDPGAGQDPIFRRIARLLALASSANVHEAEAAMNTAQRLMLKHNIDAAVAAAREGYTFRQVGASRSRVDGWQHALASLLGEHFFVEVIWVPSYLPSEGRRGRVLEMCGTPANLEVAAYVHDFLGNAGERLWREHKRARGITGDRERRRFLMGVILGFEDKLRRGADENQRAGLVYVGDPGLASYLRRRYPRRTSGSGTGFRPTETFEQGRRAGRKLVLHRGIHETTARGRLLGPAARG